MTLTAFSANNAEFWLTIVAVPPLRVSCVLPVLLLPYGTRINVSTGSLSCVLPAMSALRRLSRSQLASVTSCQLAMRNDSIRCWRTSLARMDSLAHRMVSIVAMFIVKSDERNIAAIAAATVVSIKVKPRLPVEQRRCMSSLGAGKMPTLYNYHNDRVRGRGGQDALLEMRVAVTPGFSRQD